MLPYILHFLSVTLCLIPECLASRKHPEIIGQVTEQSGLADVAACINGRGKQKAEVSNFLFFKCNACSLQQ